MRQRLLLLSMALMAAVAGCQLSATDRDADRLRDPELLHAAMDQLTEVMIHDIFSPPQASRAYAYASIAAYEALAPGHAAGHVDHAAHVRYRSLAGQLNGLAHVPAPDTSRAHHLPLASVHAFLTVAEGLVYSVGRMHAFHEAMHVRFEEAGLPADVFERSVAYGERVGQHVLAWAARDGYDAARSAPRFTVTGEPGRWQPTPPAYMNGVNPNWNMLRPFVLDSAAQFKPERPLAYSMEPGTPFFEEAREVYEVDQTLTDEQRAIAAFWDCNPYVMHTRGHAMFATKQITPGGHWMAIAAIASRKAGRDLMQTAAAYAAVSVALADGFISAFDEKYRSALVRPETVINRHIDETWQPLLQTPPFPEYPSAHSVISAAAAVVLTDRFGPSFAFDDTSEVAYGLPVRSFTSFEEAAEEAAVSRLYGGIHYRRAIDEGLEQGRALGRHVLGHVDLRRPPLVASDEM